ncbi:MAG: YbjN domain-containing protein [Mitsuaria chitosanitabida]|uniref:YbjN domain-containing protein n=1 Tax=Roseateles chitosanitabidus TaxID=65048 RepID=UPI001B026CE6|nr:YbjN domain-containing protein [Roseateles chitosanitabidus]MBO9688189.1 YbjN domain-containing protein [Roseateles chitosanitabidus]
MTETITTPSRADQATLPADDLIAPLRTAVSAREVADAIRASGCAVSEIEQDGIVHLHSASQGLGFQVLWGNRAAADRFVDFTLSCPLRVQGGALPEGLTDEWHRARRFARLARHGEMLVLEMDVVVAGGVGPEYVGVALRLWMQMMGEYFVHLRNYRASETGAGAVSPAAVEPSLATAG